eukprot:6474091-Amphidinium_carterae.1
MPLGSCMCRAAGDQAVVPAMQVIAGFHLRSRVTNSNLSCANVNPKKHKVTKLNRIPNSRDVL